LRERVHVSTQHAVHDTCDGVQSESQSTASRQCEASNFEQEGDVGVERGLAAVSWRADATVRRRSRVFKRSALFLNSIFRDVVPIQTKRRRRFVLTLIFPGENRNVKNCCRVLNSGSNVRSFLLYCLQNLKTYGP